MQNKHAQRTCLMYHAACKVECQPFNRSYSQLTFFNFLIKYLYTDRAVSKCVKYQVSGKDRAVRAA